jgi:hypothetical protein
MPLMRRPVVLAVSAVLMCGTATAPALAERARPGPSSSSLPATDAAGAAGAAEATDAPAELPGGGRVLFPGRRLVALYGHPGAPSLGVLGEQGVAAAVVRARRVARPYKRLGRAPVVPAFELIATVAQRSAGKDGDYSGEAPVRKLRPWVRAAARAGMYVVLDLQPGRADVLDQAKRYRSLLKEPHVGLAVDPEWKLASGQKPLGQIGSIDAREINRTSAWLAALVREHDLPQKLFVVHQFRLSMIGREHLVRTDRPEVALLVHMDGQGTASQKHATWSAVKRARPAGVPLGWKNFYDEDSPTFTPKATMAKRPRPRMISYQ